eukprot:4901491-Prymnesium_polylepis.1
MKGRAVRLRPRAALRRAAGARGGQGCVAGGGARTACGACDLGAPRVWSRRVAGGCCRASGVGTGGARASAPVGRCVWAGGSVRRAECRTTTSGQRGLETQRGHQSGCLSR